MVVAVVLASTFTACQMTIETAWTREAEAWEFHLDGMALHPLRTSRSACTIQMHTRDLARSFTSVRWAFDAEHIDPAMRKLRASIVA